MRLGSLGEYKRKRDFERTPEPGPEEHKPTKPLNFVIHDHYAKRHHFDLRFEDPKTGELISFALPKARMPKGRERMLLVRTENHPFSYLRFEGTIPEGHYGAGKVKIEDIGTYEIVEGSFDKSVVVDLKGKKNKGKYKIYKTPFGYLIQQFKERRS